MKIKYEIRNYAHLQNIGQISNESFSLHIRLYEGYVKNTNIILEKLENFKDMNTEDFMKIIPEFNELHRRFGWEFNGMRLHELFFDSLVTQASNTILEDSSVFKLISVNFGSFEMWKSDFEQIAKTRGMGWAMLVQDKKTGQILNTWVNEHDAGMIADVNIILNIDMFEHAYIKDFGIDRQSYLNSIWAHLNWEVLDSRLNE